jgi:hypothetical protein
MARVIPAKHLQEFRIDLDIAQRIFALRVKPPDRFDAADAFSGMHNH